MKDTITLAKPSMTERIRRWLLDVLEGVDKDVFDRAIHDVSTKQFDLGKRLGIAEGERKARIKFAVLPLPFTAEQLIGRQYGEFITPVGFATPFGECNIPAPGPHGYEQRAYYVSKSDLELRAASTDLRCHSARKFNDAANCDTLVPVIVTVLR